MNLDLIPHPSSGPVLRRAAAGIASITLAAALTSCSFEVGELEPVGEGESASADAAETEEAETGEQPEEGETEEAAGAESTGELPVDPSEAVAWDEETFWLSGTGEALYRLDWTASADTTLQLSHSGSANFIVVPYDADGTRLGGIANETGAYEGDSVLDDAAILGGAGEIEFIHIQADGAWTIGR
ncbi:hypothetical protein ACFO4E_24575 [Nocardiopsis mangrovi]|uniref:Uncharacterized protein n=1 Tax=Nocardiopsis mangrovi TaxID=1179818 RepID=A0ABV9E3B0_9ACTN